MPGANQRRGLRPVVKWALVVIVIFTLGFFVRGCWNEDSGIIQRSEPTVGETELQREVRLLRDEQTRLEKFLADLKASLRDAEEAAREEAKLGQLIDERERAREAAQDALQKARSGLQQWLEGLKEPSTEEPPPDPATAPDAAAPAPTATAMRR